MLHQVETNSLLEQTASIEKIPKKLNSLLADFIYERYKTPKAQEKKEKFFSEFDLLPAREKRTYKDFVRNVIIDMSEELYPSQTDNDDSLQLQEILSDMAKIDRYEIYAWILNHSRNPEPMTWFKEPSFFLTWGSISGKWEDINIGSINYPTLNQFNSHGEYELELDLYIPNLAKEKWIKEPIPTKFIISKNDETGEYTIYNQERIKETSLKPKNGILHFTIARIQRTFTLQIQE